MAKLKLSSLFFLIDDFLSVRILYNNIKEDNYAKQNSSLLGRKATKNILLFGGFLIATAFTIKWLLNSYLTAKIFSLIVSGALLIFLVPYILISFPSAINLTAKQLKLNKRFIGFFNVFLLIAVLVISIIICSSIFKF